MKQMQPIIAALVLTLLPAVASGQAGRPEKRPPPACGITTLPLQAGNSWTYRSGMNEVVLAVISVAPGKDAAGRAVTEIKVEEQFGTRKIAMTWSCTEAGLTISPESLLFAGEPGGGVGFKLAITSRDNVTLPSDAIAILDYQWVHTFKAEVTRDAAQGSETSHTPAKIEVERHGLVHPPSPIDLPIGSWGALKMTFELRGRGIVQGQASTEKAEIPVKRPGALYYVKKLGVVRIEDAFDKTWDLVSTNVPIPLK